MAIGFFQDSDISVIHECFGLPESGLMMIVLDLSRRPESLAAQWEPVFAQGTLTNVVTALHTNLAAINQTNYNRCLVYINRWITITANDSRLRIDKGSTGAEGSIVDYRDEKGEIRKELGNLIGLWVPADGFFGESVRQFQQFTSDLGGGGDR